MNPNTVVNSDEGGEQFSPLISPVVLLLVQTLWWMRNGPACFYDKQNILLITFANLILIVVTFSSMKFVCVSCILSTRSCSLHTFSYRPSWSYGSWIYNYLCNQYLSPLKVRIRTPFMAWCTQYNIMWSSLSVTWHSSGVFSGTPVSSTNKTDRHDITEILLKVTLSTSCFNLIVNTDIFDM